MRNLVFAISLAGAAALFATTTLTSTTAWGYELFGLTPCKAVVEAKLNELKVDRSDITETSYIMRYLMGLDDKAVGVDVWVSFQSCRGNLVIQLDQSCLIKQTYWRGDCPSKRAGG